MAAAPALPEASLGTSAPAATHRSHCKPPAAGGASRKTRPASSIQAQGPTGNLKNAGAGDPSLTCSGSMWSCTGPASCAVITSPVASRRSHGTVDPPAQAQPHNKPMRWAELAQRSHRERVGRQEDTTQGPHHRKKPSQRRQLRVVTAARNGGAWKMRRCTQQVAHAEGRASARYVHGSGSAWKKRRCSQQAAHTRGRKRTWHLG